jgi:histidyl-tRNA synthetase
MHLTRLRGFQDLLGPSVRAVTTVEDCARRHAKRHGIQEIRIPVIERVELYQRSSGETSDIVEKQMYAFTDKDEAETLIALRPEGTPSVVRAYIEAGMDRSDPERRFYYSGPMFRRERPQKGRFRQFHQFGVEIFGRPDPACDAELLVLIDEIRRDLKLALDFQINSLGDNRCRPAYRAAVLEYGRAHWDQLCKDCHDRLERNPLRLLDCKIDVKLAENAPKSLDFLCDPCRIHFSTVERLLEIAKVPFTINPRLVRGLDYYTRTAFEVVSKSVGSQSAVVAGGRYDGLVEALGGAPVPGIGFAIGVERLALAIEANEALAAPVLDTALIALGSSSLGVAVRIAAELRARQLSVELLSPERGLKALMRRANKLGARFALIIGEDELARGVAQLRDLRASTQREVSLDSVATELSASSISI